MKEMLLMKHSKLKRDWEELWWGSLPVGTGSVTSRGTKASRWEGQWMMIMYRFTGFIKSFKKQCMY